jgi:hypothetical protein
MAVTAPRFAASLAGGESENEMLAGQRQRMARCRDRDADALSAATLARTERSEIAEYLLIVLHLCCESNCHIHFH